MSVSSKLRYNAKFRTKYERVPCPVCSRMVSGLKNGPRWHYPPPVVSKVKCPGGFNAKG